MSKLGKWLCKHNFHKWSGWRSGIDGTHVIRQRRCLRCLSEDFEEGYIANAERKNTNE